MAAAKLEQGRSILDPATATVGVKPALLAVCHPLCESFNGMFPKPSKMCKFVMTDGFLQMYEP
jgi:hypothetical protein